MGFLWIKRLASQQHIYKSSYHMSIIRCFEICCPSLDKARQSYVELTSYGLGKDRARSQTRQVLSLKAVDVIFQWPNIHTLQLHLKTYLSDRLKLQPCVLELHIGGGSSIKIADFVVL